MTLPGSGTKGAGDAANPVTGGKIEVTALPDAPSAVSAPAVAPVGRTAPDSAAIAAPAAAAAPVPAAGPAKAEATAPAAANTDAEAPAAPEPAPPQVVKSEAQLACEKKKGIWSRAGAGAYACVSYTKDSGKSCTASSQCDSQCLARSNTCAPFKPLFGCNDILDDSGRRMTQCLD